MPSDRAWTKTVRLMTRARIRARVASAVLLRLRPTFLVVGAQKSGTTALYEYLCRHQAVLTARIKEVDYFDLNYWLGDRWYRSHFPLRSDGLRVRSLTGVPPAVGEVSPDYLLDPRVPERVRRFDSTLKLLALLRDPVERAYSQYAHEVRRGRETRSFEDALEQEHERLEPELARMLAEPSYVSFDYRHFSYLARGCYAEQLERWFAVFSREQLLVLESGWFRREPTTGMAKICAFLGVPAPEAGQYSEVGPTTYAQPLAPATREWLARYFEPHNRRLSALLGREFDWTRPGEVGSELAGVG